MFIYFYKQNAGFPLQVKKVNICIPKWDDWYHSHIWYADTSSQLTKLRTQNMCNNFQLVLKGLIL